MDAPDQGFALAGTLEELKAERMLVIHGGHRPILVVYDRGRVFALDNRCPHMGFPLERGSVGDGILTCHWHHAHFDLESGCTFVLLLRDPTFRNAARDREGRIAHVGDIVPDNLTHQVAGCCAAIEVRTHDNQDEKAFCRLRRREGVARPEARATEELA